MFINKIVELETAISTRKTTNIMQRTITYKTDIEMLLVTKKKSSDHRRKT